MHKSLKRTSTEDGEDELEHPPAKQRLDGVEKMDDGITNVEGAGAGDFKKDSTETGIKEVLSELKSVNSRMSRMELSMNSIKGQVEVSGNTLQSLDTRMQKTETLAEQASAMAKDTHESQEQMKREIQQLKLDLEEVKRRPNVRGESNAFRKLDKKVEKQEGYSRRCNLLIVGMKEEPQENDTQLYEKVTSFIANILGVTGIKFDVTHRVGAAAFRKDRRVIVKFFNLTDKTQVWEARHNLKAKENAQYKLLMDKPNAMKEREALSFKVLQAAQNSHNYKFAKFIGGKVIIDHVAYRYEDFDMLPEELSPNNIYSPRSALAIAFFTKHSMLSNHYLTIFEVEGVRYTSVEQYLARSRALYAGNMMVARQAMQTDDPVELKRILHDMHQDGYEGNWLASAEARVIPALDAKFRQDGKARKFLLETEDRKIGEASFDVVWGIGKTLTDKNLLDTSQWKGENTMGKALEKVRQSIKEGAEKTILPEP